MYINGQFREHIGFVVGCVLAAMVFGAVFGSFACCQAWRIRLKQKGRKLGKRSVCLKCGRRLKWYENIPIVSWIIQRGKCRGCEKKIGSAEIVTEVLGMIGFIGVGLFFAKGFLEIATQCGFGLGYFCGQNFELIFLVLSVLLVLAIFVTMTVIAVYDAKWGEMPTKLLNSAVILAGVFAVLMAFWSGFSRAVVDGASQIAIDYAMVGDYLLSAGESVLILAGTYYILYKVSDEKWVGGGDYILCLAIALVLGKPFLALLELTLANILGLAVMLPQKKRKKMIPFGPFLVIAFAILFCFV